MGGKLETHSVMSQKEYQDAVNAARPVYYYELRCTARVDGLPVQFAIRYPESMEDRARAWMERQRRVNNGGEVNGPTHIVNMDFVHDEFAEAVSEVGNQA